MSRQRFFAMLDSYPRLASYWDQAQECMHVEIFEQALGAMSCGERHMAKFFAAVWFNDNQKYGFDLVDAVASLDVRQRQLIMQWIAKPFWP